MQAHRILPALLPLLLAAGGEPPSLEGDVLRLYDVAAIGAVHAEHDTSAVLLPILGSGPEDELEAHYTNDEHRPVDELAELVGAVFAEELEYEGRGFEITPAGSLAVRGPEGLHARIETLLGFVERVADSRAELTVDLVRLPRGAAELPGEGLVDAAAVRPWIQLGRERGAHRRVVLHLRADRPTRVDLAREFDLLVSYDVEIAQSAFVHDPIVTPVSLGVRLGLRGAPTPGGLQLALTLRRGDELGPPVTREIPLVGLLKLDGSATREISPSVFQDLPLLNRSLALDTFLPRDRALALSTSIERPRGGAREVVFLRWTGGDLPLAESLAIGERGAELIACNVARVDPPVVQAYGSLVRPGEVLRGLPMPWSGTYVEPVLAAWLAPGDREFAVEQVLGFGEEKWVQTWAGLSFVLPLEAAAAGEGRLAAFGAGVRGALDGLTGEERLVDLSITVRRGDATPAEMRLPVRSGGTAAVALGIENIRIGNYHVEVANSSAAPDPRAATAFDGLVLWLRPSLGVLGDLALEVRGGARLLVGEAQALDLRGGLLNELDQARHDQLFVNERLSFRADAERPWRAVLGDASGSGLRIEIEVARP